MSAAVRRRRFSAEEYLLMASAGVFGPDARVELMEGEVLRIGPKGDVYVDALAAPSTLLVLAYYPAGYLVRPRMTFRAGPHSMPEPDLAAVPADLRGVVEVDRAVLLVEIAESSPAIGCGTKARLYAEQGAPCYWIVEVAARRVRVLTEPADGAYRAELLAGLDDRLVLPGLTTTLAVRDFLSAPGEPDTPEG